MFLNEYRIGVVVIKSFPEEVTLGQSLEYKEFLGRKGEDDVLVEGTVCGRH